jgi:hypothetical protein
MTNNASNAPGSPSNPLKASVEKDVNIGKIERDFSPNSAGNSQQECSVGQPGPLEAFIPFWGSGRSAVDDFQNKRWGPGLFNLAMAITDVVPLKGVVAKAGFKLLTKLKAPKLVMGLLSKANTISKAGVRYNSRGFPVFKSKFNMKLPKNLFKASDGKQFQAANKALKEAIQKNPKLRSRFTEKQLKHIMKETPSRKPPPGLTWHHHQNPGRMQLVNRKEHAGTPHIGGRSIWGGGKENR